MNHPTLPGRLIGLALIALLVPTAAAVDTGPLAVLDAGRIDVDDALGEASLLGLLIQRPQGEPGPLDPSPGPLQDVMIQASAEAILVETVREDRTGTIVATTSETTQADASFGPATLATGRAGAGRMISILPMHDGDPTARLGLDGSGTLRPSSRASLEAELNVERPDGQTFARDTHAGMTWNIEDREIIGLQGDLLLILWDVDADITSDGGRQHFPSGESDRPLAADPTGLSQETGLFRTVRQVFIHLWNASATLTLGGQAAQERSLYIAAPHITATEIALRDVEGTLSDGTDMRPLTTPDLRLQGDLDLDVEGRPGSLHAVVRGDLLAAHSETGPLAWAAEPRTSNTWARPLVFAGLAAAVVTPAAIQGGRRTHQRQGWLRVERAERLLHGGHPDVAAHLTRPLLTTPTVAPLAAVVHIQALVDSGRTADARTALARVADDLLDPAWRDFLGAYLACAQGHIDRALGLLAPHLTTRPEFRAEVWQNPHFALLRRHPRLRWHLRAPPDEVGGVDA